MIPRTLHHVWVGPKPVPFPLVEAWRAMHPNWEHRLWRERDIRAFGLRNANAFAKYMRLGLWHGAVNVARIEILNREGGVYVDMDTVPMRPFGNAVFMRSKIGLFAGYVQPRPEYPGLIGNAYIGAVPGHPVLRIAMDTIARCKRLTPPYVQTGVLPFSNAVKASQALGRDDIYIAPTHVFYPVDKDGIAAPEGKGRIYARHFWGSTVSTPWNYGDPVP